MTYLIISLALTFTPRTAWDSVKTYVCYYGKGRINDITQFDVAIMEPRNYTEDEIRSISDAGTWVIGYVSLGESDGLHKGDGKGPGGYASYYFDDDGDGQPDMNPNWHSYYINPASTLWHKHIFDRIKKLKKQGVVGIFMDTIDNADLKPEFHDAMIQLIKEIRDSFPDMKLVANRGFTILEDIAPVIDGMMWEDFSMAGYDFKKKKYLEADSSFLWWTDYFAVNFINRLRARYNFQVFALDYADPSDTEKIAFYYNRACSYGFIPYVATIFLDSVFHHTVRCTVGLSERAFKFDPLFRLKGDIYIRESEYNLAFKGNGGKVTTDSYDISYRPDVLNDGIRNDFRMLWSDAAWASDDSTFPHFIDVQLADGPAKIESVIIYWPRELSMIGDYFETSRHIKIFIDNRLVADVKPLGRRPRTKIIINNITGSRVRIEQDRGDGSVDRPDMMWVAEVEVYGRTKRFTH